jgi:hypothetical protein
MKASRRETPEQLVKIPDDEMDLNDAFIEDGWGDVLKKNIQSFWESIDDEINE